VEGCQPCPPGRVARAVAGAPSLAYLAGPTWTQSLAPIEQISEDEFIVHEKFMLLDWPYPFRFDGRTFVAVRRIDGSVDHFLID
jgi:hypothetical protein